MSKRPRNSDDRANKRDYESCYQRETGRQLNEIAPIPECADERLRSRLEADPPEWLRAILPDVFFSEFTERGRRFVS